MRALASFVLQGTNQAVAVVAGAAGFSLVLPVLSIVSSAALALVTLRKGLRDGALVFGLVLVLTAGVGAASQIGVYLALGFGLLLWLPALILGLVLRESGSLASSLELAFGVGSLMVVGIYVVNDDPASLWIEPLRQMFQSFMSNPPPEIDTKTIEEYVVRASHFSTGFVIGRTVLAAVFSLLLARWWQDVLFNPGGFRAEFLGLRLHRWFAYVSAALIAASLGLDGWMREVSWNMVAPFFVAFMIAGFAVFHGLLAAPGSRSFLLVGLYVVSFFIPPVLIPVALVGFSDIWMDWRSKGQLPS